MTNWATHLAWMVNGFISLLPVLGRWFDPAPVRDPSVRVEPLSLLLDVLAAVSHRAWALPAVVALSMLVGALTAAAFAMLVHQGLPKAQRNHVLWPLMGLGLALMVCTLLDEHLPEFGQ